MWLSLKKERCTKFPLVRRKYMEERPVLLFCHPIGSIGDTLFVFKDETPQSDRAGKIVLGKGVVL